MQATHLVARSRHSGLTKQSSFPLKSPVTPVKFPGSTSSLVCTNIIYFKTSFFEDSKEHGLWEIPVISQVEMARRQENLWFGVSALFITLFFILQSGYGIFSYFFKSSILV